MDKLSIKISRSLIIALILFNFATAEAYVLTFTPRARVRAEVSDNIYRSFENKEQDVILTITAGFLSEAEWKNYGFSLSYDPSYSHYAKNDESNSLRHFARATGWANLSKNTRIDVSDSFVRTEDPFAEAFITDPGLEEGGGNIRQGRSAYNTNVATVSARQQLGEQKSIALGFAHRTVMNEDPLIEDNNSYTPSAQLIFWPAPNLWGFEMGSSYTKGMYELESDDFQRWTGDIRLIARISRHLDGFLQYSQTMWEYEGDTENYNIYRPSVGIHYIFPRDAELNLGVGPIIQDNEISEDKSTFLTDLDFRKTWHYRQSDIVFTATNGYRESYIDVDNLGPSLFFGAAVSASHNFSKWFLGDIYTSYRFNRFINSLPGEDEREDRSAYAGAGMTYIINQYISATARYYLYYRDSSDEEFNFSENRFSLIFDFSASRPYRSVR